MATEDFLCLKSQFMPCEEEEEATMRPSKAEGTTRPGSPPTLLLLRDKSPCQNKKKVKENVENGNC